MNNYLVCIEILYSLGTSEKAINSIISSPQQHKNLPTLFVISFKSGPSKLKLYQRFFFPIMSLLYIYMVNSIPISGKLTNTYRKADFYKELWIFS